ncbi:hypothetical protein MRB53_039806 [Persea americana]|nr:hypothetical protein MRB53_039806 [Persea americana]
MVTVGRRVPPKLPDRNPGRSKPARLPIGVRGISDMPQPPRTVDNDSGTQTATLGGPLDSTTHNYASSNADSPGAGLASPASALFDTSVHSSSSDVEHDAFTHSDKSTSQSSHENETSVLDQGEDIRNDTDDVPSKSTRSEDILHVSRSSHEKDAPMQHGGEETVIVASSEPLHATEHDAQTNHGMEVPLQDQPNEIDTIAVAVPHVKESELDGAQSQQDAAVEAASGSSRSSFHSTRSVTESHNSTQASKPTDAVPTGLEHTERIPMPTSVSKSASAESEPAVVAELSKSTQSASLSESPISTSAAPAAPERIVIDNDLDEIKKPFSPSEPVSVGSHDAEVENPWTSPGAAEDEKLAARPQRERLPSIGPKVSMANIRSRMGP